MLTGTGFNSNVIRRADVIDDDDAHDNNAA